MRFSNIMRLNISTSLTASVQNICSVNSDEVGCDRSRSRLVRSRSRGVESELLYVLCHCDQASPHITTKKRQCLGRSNLLLSILVTPLKSNNLAAVGLGTDVELLVYSFGSCTKGPDCQCSHTLWSSHYDLLWLTNPTA